MDFAISSLPSKKLVTATVSLEDFYLFEQGKKELPARSFVLTFDDGRIDSYVKADPILRALGYNAVMFVATSESVEKNKDQGIYYLTPLQLKEMIATGRWEIGSHAVQEGGGFVTIDTQGTRANFLSNKKWLTAQDRLETDEEYTARATHELGTFKTGFGKNIWYTRECIFISIR
jgi:biofilm PGA synthesis lipoprotein PgaB